MGLDSYGHRLHLLTTKSAVALLCDVFTRMSLWVRLRTSLRASESVCMCMCCLRTYTLVHQYVELCACVCTNVCPPFMLVCVCYYALQRAPKMSSSKQQWFMQIRLDNTICQRHTNSVTPATLNVNLTLFKNLNISSENVFILPILMQKTTYCVAWNFSMPNTFSKRHIISTEYLN